MKLFVIAGALAIVTLQQAVVTQVDTNSVSKPTLMADNQVIVIEEEMEQIPIDTDEGEDEDKPAVIEEKFDASSMLAESDWNLDPLVTFYLNAIMSVVVMTGASLRYNLYNDGDFDNFLWYIHIIGWGQNLMVFFIALFFDSYYTREMYFRSGFATAIVSYIGMPVYIIWNVAYNAIDRDAKLSSLYFWGWLIFFIVYTFMMQSYSKNSLLSLQNYATLLIIDDLEERWNQDKLQEKEDELLAFDEDATRADGDEDPQIESDDVDGKTEDEILDEWIFPSEETS